MLPKEESPVLEIKSYVRCLPAVWSETCSTKHSMLVREAAEDDTQMQGPCKGQVGGKEAKFQGTPFRRPVEGKDQAEGVHCS